MKKSIFAIGAVCMFLVLGLSSVACAEGTSYKYEYSGLVMKTVTRNVGTEEEPELIIESTAICVISKKTNEDTGEVVETKLLRPGTKFVCDKAMLSPTLNPRVILITYISRILSLFNIEIPVVIIRPHLMLQGINNNVVE